MPNRDYSFSPIGVFSCDQQYPQQAPRQGSLNTDNGRGHIDLNGGCNFEQALQDLDRFDKIWLIYVFDRNDHWKPLVSPPRGSGKRGVFSSRAPYRPNPIGMSCVTLLAVTGRQVFVDDFDLLDGTPILDIKPYLAYADSFPEASSGWIKEGETVRYDLVYSPRATEKIAWIGEHAGYDIAAFIANQLREAPLDDRRKRISPAPNHPGSVVIAARTWRIRYCVDEQEKQVRIEDLWSGYSVADLVVVEDKYADKSVHQAYNTMSWS